MTEKRKAQAQRKRPAAAKVDEDEDGSSSEDDDAGADEDARLAPKRIDRISRLAVPLAYFVAVVLSLLGMFSPGVSGFSLDALRF